MYTPQIHSSASLGYPPQQPGPPNNLGGFYTLPFPPQMHAYYPGSSGYPPMATFDSPPAPVPPPVLNTNGTATNSGSTTTSTTRTRRKRTSGGRAGGNKRPRQTNVEIPEPTAPSSNCGVGPPTITVVGSANEDIENRDPNNTSVPELSGPATIPMPNPAAASSKQSTRRYQNLPAAATDVWYFLRPLQTDEEPTEKPTEEPILSYKPSTPYVGCKLCTDKWKVWKVANGMTQCYRDHLKKFHGDIYETAIRVKGLKNSETSSNLPSSLQNDEPFSIEKFLDLLQRWLVVDDQSIHVLECPEFRDLLLYLGAGKIEDKDLPHRHKMTDMIFEAYRKRIDATVEEMKHAEGRISFTDDLWSDQNLDSYMAITSHFYVRDDKGKLQRRNGLVAFRFIEGSHSGVNLARNFIKVIEEFGVLGKIGAITMDNASNNNTMMEELEKELTRRGIPFERDGNRIRCFPHIINIACQTILSELKKASEIYIEAPPMSDPPTEEEQENWENYLKALEADLVGRCRSIVASCRASGQRRQALLKKIDDGNRTGYWKGKLDNGKDKIRLVQLLRDCETRWSSTFNLIDRVLELYVAIRDFLLDLEQSTITDSLMLNPLQKSILQDIHQVLQVAHLAQELLSAERTPTLSMALPVFETLIAKWKALSSTIPELKHFLDLGVSKLEEYVGKARKTRLYALAMILNPGQKFTWLRENDKTGQDAKNAREWMLEAMLSFKRHDRTRAPSQSTRTLSRSSSFSEPASANIAHGYGRLQSLDVTVRRSSSLIQRSITPVQSSLQVPTPHATQAPQETAEEAATRKARELEEDKDQVERELRRYEEGGIVTSFENTGMVNIDEFWSVHQYEYPLLFRVAMDVLPVQASSVPCERVFSSSKETCALRRNRISPELLEALQVLKFSYRSERLSFVEEVAKEADYVISGPVTESAIDELMAAGKFAELNQLIQNSRERS